MDLENQNPSSSKIHSTGVDGTKDQSNCTADNSTNKTVRISESDSDETAKTPGKLHQYLRFRTVLRLRDFAFSFANRSRTRSFVSKNASPPPWVKVPHAPLYLPLFEEGETVLLLRPGKAPKGPYVIRACYANERYGLSNLKETFHESELERQE